MGKIIIDCTEDITRTAVTDDKGLAELLIDKKDAESTPGVSSIVGTIYAGRVKNILPSQFVFVDIGRGKNGFLYLNDKKEASLYAPDNRLLIKQGDSLLVQAVRDETSGKGAYLTTQVSFTGRFFVLIKTDYHKKEISFSKKITDESERQRIRAAVYDHISFGYSLIVRTNSEGKESDALMREVCELVEKSREVCDKWQFVKPPAVVYAESNVIEKNIRDLYNESIDEIVINGKNEYEQIVAGGQYGKISYFENKDHSIFEYYGIESQIEKALYKKVWLASGGFLYIERTEACSVIDVNSGKFLGKNGHEQSALKLNLEAAREIARQVRLRNLSGIIIIDFIDMKNDESKEKLLETLRQAFFRDRVSASVVGMTTLGLVEVTRKRTRESLYDMLKDRNY